MVNFGAIIKKYRYQVRVTQKELSNDLNVTSTYLSAVENGRKEPSIALLKKICKVLDIPEEILFWESVEIKDGFEKDEKKAIEFAKIIVRAHYENLNASSVKV